MCLWFWLSEDCYLFFFQDVFPCLFVFLVVLHCILHFAASELDVAEGSSHLYWLPWGGIYRFCWSYYIRDFLWPWTGTPALRFLLSLKAAFLGTFYLLQLFLFVCFWPHQATWGIFVLDQELNPSPWQWKLWVLTTGPAFRAFITHQAGRWKLLLCFPAGGVTAQVCGLLLCP